MAKYIEYIDDEGRKLLVALDDDAPDSEAYMGVVIGPPDLTELNLPLHIEIKLNNELFDRGLLTAKDVKGKHQNLFSVIQATYKADVVALSNIFLKSEKHI